MDVTSFPYEVLDRIIEFCPNFIQRALLESKTCAELAYKHYYKNVFIKESLVLDDDDRLKNQYSGFCDFDRYEGTSLNHPRRYFFDARSLIVFYRTHPYYHPHTLHIYDSQHLEAFYSLDPNFLKNFKHIEFTALRSGYLSEKFFDLPFRSFVALDSGRLPESITKLELVECDFRAPNHIQELELNGVEVDFDDLKEFPYLTKLHLVDYGTLVLDLPHLKKLILESPLGDADLSGCVNLEDLAIESRFEYYTLGFDEDDTFRLPHNLRLLLLKKVCFYDSLEDISQLDTLQFFQLIIEEADAEPELIVLPSSLDGLIIHDECDLEFFFDVPENLS